MSDTQLDIKRVCHSLENFLVEKNQRYGDSAINPVRIFSKTENRDQLLNRIDDKLSRIANSECLRKNDVVDITGYLILLCVANRWTDFTDQLD